MKEKLKMPDGWHEITLGQYQEICGLDETSKDYALNIFSIILDKDPEEIRNYSPQTADKIMRHLEWAMKTPSDDEYKQEIEIEGVTYRLVENLNRFTGGEWWDMEQCMSDFKANLHKVFALIYRPLEKEWSYEVRKKSEVLFQDKVMIGDLYGSTVFFCNVALKSTLTIQDYLLSQIQPKKKLPKILQRIKSY